MKDEEYSFVSDVIDKKITARSARNRRTHNGKGGAVKFPSDYLSKKELQAMNGECKTYRLNEPMKWADFKDIPDDLKITYIKLLREKFNVPDCKLAEAMGIGRQSMIREVCRLGINKGKKGGGHIEWDKDAFYSWWSGAKITETATEDAEQKTDAANEDERETVSLEYISEPVKVPVAEIKTLPARVEKATAIPCSGNLSFVGSAEAALNTVSVLLGGANVRISITWEALQEEAGVDHG